MGFTTLKNPLISIIVPIYKVDSYLRRCLDSIVNQTYTNLEIILVNDGSPDESPAICHEYATKDNRIIVIHKKNGGLSDARNAGLDICKGDFISFVDGDDWIADNYVEELFNQALKEKANIVIGNFLKVYLSQHIDCSNFTKMTQVLNNQQAVLQLFGKLGTTFVTTWGKLYQKNVFNSIRFPRGVIHEDEYTTYKLLYTSPKTVFLDKPLYFYFQRPDSIMGQKSHNSTNALKAYLERRLFFKEKKEEKIQLECSKRLCWDLLSAYSESKIYNKCPADYKSPSSILSEYRFIVKEYNSYQVSHFIHVFFHKIFSLIPYLYVFYRKIKLGRLFK